MIKRKDIIEYVLPEKDWGNVILNARKAEIGGKSQIRSTGDRAKTLSEDQLVGQIATYAGSMVLTGSPDGYCKAREIANKNPHKGDGGVDIVGLDNIDIKGSMMRYSSNPLKYRLLVRPRERHKGWIYVLAMVPKKRPYTAFVVGWANDGDLPKEAYNGTVESLRGAYVVEATRLRKILWLSLFNMPRV